MANAGLSSFGSSLVTSGGAVVLPGFGGIPFTGNYWFVDPVNGLDGNSGQSPNDPFKTLYQGHNHATAGNNDVVVLIGNGASSGSARLSTALAQNIDSTVTAGTLVWSKAATHLVGVCAPSMYAQRARIAPPTGTYTQATFGSANFVTVTASGCFFGNFSVFNGFSTGGTNQICWTDTGSRNAYANVAFGGMGDATSAADAGSRSLKVGAAGSGENFFSHCTIGIDTVTRSAANASLEFSGGTPRNVFEDCIFPFQTSSASVLGILGTGNACVDRSNYFRRTLFSNNIKSTSTQMTALVSFTTSAPGGLLNFDAGSSMIGITKWGDTNGLANSYVMAGSPTNSTSGIAVNPT